MKNYDFLIVGAGIFGICTALELKKRNYSVSIINPDTIPNPLAASTDISKVIRMEYGSDTEYMQMAIAAMEVWREWNAFFQDTLYHEVGYLLLTQESLDSEAQIYDKRSYENVVQSGFKPERLNNGEITKRFPAFNSEIYTDGHFHAVGGFGESGRIVEVLANYARSLGIDVYEGQTAEKLVLENRRVEKVITREGMQLSAGQVIICAGNFTPYLLPELKPYMKITGHPVFHLKPSQPDLFTPPNFAVFAADIANSGWYGFPLHPTKKVVKVAKHAEGLELHPEHDERVVTKEDELALRKFLAESIPVLANDPIVYTRRCCYTDTLDGHFWIDNHPEIENVTVGSGGSGHGFKMGPIVGEMIATIAEGGQHKWSNRYQWRELNQETVQQEEARFLQSKKL